MVWALSIGTFLATLAIVLVLGILFSRKEQIRQALREMRRETRALAKVVLELSGEAFGSEVVLTENMSRHGARILSKNNFPQNDRVFVKFPQAEQPSRARIAYCNTMPGNLFAVGLQFSSALELPNIESSFAGSSLSPYGK